MTEPYLLACLRRRLYDERGFIIGLPDLINFYLSFKPRAFVILTGISGTGKSRLPRLVAEMIRDSRKATDANYESVAVRPGWNDVTDLFGFYNSLQEGFEPGPVVPAFRKASEAIDDDGRFANFLILDELNLARVEHYFADFLSVMESRRPNHATGEWETDPLQLAGGRNDVLRFINARDEGSNLPFINSIDVTT